MRAQLHPRHHHQPADTRAESVPELRPVPAPESDPVAEVYAALAERISAEALADMDPENKLIQALLNATAAEAAEVLEFVTVDDLAAHMPRVVLTAIAELTRSGQRPTPDAVADLASGPLDIDPQPSPQALLLYVATIYTSRIQADPWPAAARVLKAAYRRSFAEFGTRMAQMADDRASLEDLEELTGDAVRRWRATRHRYRQVLARATT